MCPWTWCMHPTINFCNAWHHTNSTSNADMWTYNYQLAALTSDHNQYYSLNNRLMIYISHTMFTLLSHGLHRLTWCQHTGRSLFLVIFFKIIWILYDILVPNFLPARSSLCKLTWLNTMRGSRHQSLGFLSLSPSTHSFCTAETNNHEVCSSKTRLHMELTNSCSV